MKIIKNSDIKFKINKKLVYLPNFTIRFYTVNQKEYFLEKTQDDLVEYEREATVDDVDVILSGGTTVTEYYLPLNWNQLMFVGKGVLNYKLTNNIEDPEFPDYQFNKEEIVTTDFYIDSIEVDPEPEEGLIERIVLLEEHLAEEIVNREEADATITENLNAEEARAISAETVLQEAIDTEETRASGEEQRIECKLDQEIADRIADVDEEQARAISAETALDAKIDAETNRATTAESALTDAINAEANRATAAEAALDVKINTVSGNVISETSRATTAENALSGAIDSLDVRFFDDAKYEDSGNTKVINFYNASVVKATIDASDFIVDGMVEDVRIENGYLVIDFNTASGKQDIQIPLTDIFNPSNYYTKSETSGATEIATALAQKLNISDFNAYSGAVDTALNSKASQSDLDALNGVVTAHTADTTVHVTTSDKTKWNKVDDKLDVTDFNTYSGTVDTALAQKQNQLVAGENITISGNVISAEGGGKAVNGGTNISITTGETADTINCTLPLSSSTSSNASKIILDKNYSFISDDAVISGKNDITYTSKSIVLGNNSLLGDGSGANIEYNLAFGSNNKVTASGVYKPTASHNFIFGDKNDIYNASNCFALGYANKLKKSYQFVVGGNNTVLNENETLFGRYNVSSSASTTWGNSGNTLFSVGNGTSSARHNAFEIRQNGDIYITLDGQDVKLQDQLGGSVTTLRDQVVANTTAIAANTTALGGLSLVQLTQAEYDALATKDNNTLYVIVG